MISNISTENASGPAVVPMWSMSGLRSLLGINEDKILNLIDAGRLLWAFDLGSGLTRMDVRVMPHSVADYQAKRACTLTWDEAEKFLVPGLRNARPGIAATVTGLHIQKVCNISCTRVAGLLERQQLKALRPSRPGVGGSPQISAASFLEFLKRKRFR